MPPPPPSAVPLEEREPSFRCRAKTFQLHIQVLWKIGKTINLDKVLTEDTIEDIKIRLEGEVGLAVEDQKLMNPSDAKAMRNDRKLSEYGIRTHLTLKLSR